MSPHPRLRRVLAGLVLAALAGAGLTTAQSASTPSAADAGNPITPGNYTGLGFDQCQAPSQAAMNAWLKSSPYRAIGIYMSGALRYCPNQTYLNATWVHNQLVAGWRLLPIHLGAQAACSTRDRYQNDLISADPANDYAAARAQGRAEASDAITAAQLLGIVKESTIFYDLEAFPTSNTACSTSALKFLSAWTNGLTAGGYTSGVYSSALAAIKLLDQARQTPGNTISLPYHVWIADWNGTADANSSYISSDGWTGRRVHQFQGGHNETWGGVTINIDRDYLDLRGGPYTPPGPATPEDASPVPDPVCTTARNNHLMYRYTDPHTRLGMHVTLQCLLKQRGLYAAPVTGHWNPRTTAGVKAWQKKVGHQQIRGFTQRDWTSLVVAADTRTWLTPGTRGADVIRAQRALNAAGAPLLKITGIYDSATMQAVGAYQARRGLKVTRNVGTPTWISLELGRI